MKKINLRPLDDRVVVEPLEAEEVTAGGIVLPDTAKEKPQQGTVLAVGPGKRMLSSMAPTVAWAGDVAVAVGSPGGSRIPTATLQVLLNLVKNAAQAMAMGRYRTAGAAARAGARCRPDCARRRRGVNAPGPGGRFGEGIQRQHLIEGGLLGEQAGADQALYGQLQAGATVLGGVSEYGESSGWWD